MIRSTGDASTTAALFRAARTARFGDLLGAEPPARGEAPAARVLDAGPPAERPDVRGPAIVEQVARILDVVAARDRSQLELRFDGLGVRLEQLPGGVAVAVERGIAPQAHAVADAIRARGVTVVRVRVDRCPGVGYKRAPRGTVAKW